MDEPVYKLEQVVHSREGMEDFEGPLDLILFLLSKNKIEIQDIPIALILEQYLEYLERRQRMDLEVASEFAAMAAQLMFIKTRMLLSIEDEEAKSEMAELIRSLEERRSGENYAKIKYVTARLDAMGEFGGRIFLRTPEPMEQGKAYTYSHVPADLLAAMGEILGREERRQPLGYRASGALSGGGEGPGGFPAPVPGNYQLPAPVPGQPQPQRGGGDLSGDPGAVPGQNCHTLRRRAGLHRHCHRRGYRRPSAVSILFV